MIDIVLAAALAATPIATKDEPRFPVCAPRAQVLQDLAQLEFELVFTGTGPKTGSAQAIISVFQNKEYARAWVLVVLSGDMACVPTGGASSVVMWR